MEKMRAGGDSGEVAQEIEKSSIADFVLLLNCSVVTIGEKYKNLVKFMDFVCLGVGDGSGNSINAKKRVSRQ